MNDHEQQMLNRLTRQLRRAKHTGPFDLEETGALKDVLGLIGTEMQGNTYDGGIFRLMMEGKPPEKGHLHHILEEGSKLDKLPEKHQRLLDKIRELLKPPQATVDA